MQFWSAFLADLNELCLLTSAGVLIGGWRLIRRKQVARHRRAMLTASALALAFFISYVVKTLWIGDTTFGGPAALRTPYMVFLQIHVVLATVAGIAGVITLRRALRGDFARHRRIAPWTATMWLVATGTGLVVFLMLYVVYAPGPTTNVLRAITGH